MKKRLVSVFAVLLSVLMAGCSATTSSDTSKNGESAQSESNSGEKTVVVVATSGESNPFRYVKDGELTGYDVEVVKAIFEGLPQYELQIEITEFPSILNGLDNGRYAIGFNNFSANDERREKYDFSLPIIENANVFVVRKDDNTINSLADLSGRKAITEPGNSGATILENYNKENPDNEVEINYTEENFIKQFENIEANKYDVRIISRISAEIGIAEYGFTNLKVVPFTSENSDPGSYLLFPKGADTTLLNEVNQRIKEIYNDGTLQKISEEQLGGNYIPSESLITAE